MQIKLIGLALVVLLFGGMFFYQHTLKTTIAEQKMQLIQNEADLGKLVKEIEFMKIDKESLEDGVAALQNSLNLTKVECESRVKAVDTKYSILLKRQYKELNKLVDGGAIDEKTSDEFIKHFNSRFFAN